MKRIFAAALLVAIAIGLSAQQPQTQTHNAPTLATSGLSPNFADGEVVSGSGTSWTLAHAPSPSESLILVRRLSTFGGVVLFRKEGYTLSGTTITTVNSIGKGDLRAWYRYSY